MQELSPSVIIIIIIIIIIINGSTALLLGLGLFISSLILYLSSRAPSRGHYLHTGQD
jgi:hypothetical protein